MEDKRMPDLIVIRNTAATIWRSERSRKLLRQRWYYFMMLPGILYFIIFKYLPMWGVMMAFQNYQPHLGIWNSPWVGFAHFSRFFHEPTFWMLFRNTVLLAVYDFCFYFPLTIIIALLLNEIRKEVFKRIVQSLIYVPHFLSWVVIVGIFYMLFTTEGGIVNEAIAKLGGDKIPFLLSAGWFRTMVVMQIIWRQAGWGTIIFLAALSGVNPALYESARIDGANRWQQLWNITLPSIRSVIVILVILRLGHFLDVGFEQVFLNLNGMNREVGDIFDTYVYRIGITQGQFSYSAAVGLFKSVVGLLLVVGANRLAKKFGEEGIF
jgi:putative aldouronate transport system permease protein